MDYSKQPLDIQNDSFKDKENINICIAYEIDRICSDDFIFNDDNDLIEFYLQKLNTLINDSSGCR